MSRFLELSRDLLVRLLLHHFTVQEVIQLRILSHELYDLVHYCLSRRRSLKLFFSFAEVQAYTQQLYEHNLESDPILRLHPPGSSSDELILDAQQFLNPVVDLLVDGLVPNVAHLIIYFSSHLLPKKLIRENRFSSLMCDNVTYMISRMRTRLTGLSLLGSNKGDAIGTTVSRRLILEINQIHHLHNLLDLCVARLNLCSNQNFELYHDRFERRLIKHEQTLVVLEPKLLKKLERFSVFFNEGHFDRQFCKNSFHHLGPSLTQLVMFQLRADYSSYYIPEALLRPCLIGRTSGLSTSSITQLKLTQHLSSLLPKVLPGFTGLKSLDLVNSVFFKGEVAMPLLDVFTLLAQFCPHLTELKLTKFKFGWVQEAETLINVPQLFQITSLVLNVHKIYYHGFKNEPDELNIPFGELLKAFAYIMPNLEQLNLKTVPGYFKFRADYLRIVKQMPRLRILSIGSYYGLEFTAHQLLSPQYRKRYIRECEEGRLKFEAHLNLLFFKDLLGVWTQKNLVD